MAVDKTTSPPRVVYIMGPTASGKTELAISLAARIPCRVISVDSALVYRGMDIGTAKPSPEDLRQTPHHLIDILEPHESYSVANFLDDVKSQVSMAHQQDEVAVLVGGTMLYHHALINGLSNMPDSDAQYRDYLTGIAEKAGNEKLHAMLAEVDPVSAERIHPNDPQRLMRALDVYHQTGETLSAYQAKHTSAVSEQWQNFIVQLRPEPRKTLHEHIAARFHRMIEQGFVDEVDGLLQQTHLNRDSPSLRAVGYRQVVAYLNHELTHDEMIERGIIATRQFAKRQFTWLRSLPCDLRINPYQPDFINNATNEIINRLNDNSYSFI